MQEDPLYYHPFHNRQWEYDEMGHTSNQQSTNMVVRDRSSTNTEEVSSDLSSLSHDNDGMHEDPLYYHPRQWDREMDRLNNMRVFGSSRSDAYQVSAAGVRSRFTTTTTSKVNDVEEDRCVPEYLQCPISNEIMEDPVIDEDGHSYERTNILKWLEDHSTSPFTRRTMFDDELKTNSTLALVVEAFRRCQTPAPLFECPLSKKIMQDPVVHDDGRSYERENICRRAQTSWRLEYGFSDVLRPNRALKNAIAEFLKGNGHNRVDESSYV